MNELKEFLGKIDDTEVNLEEIEEKINSIKNEFIDTIFKIVDLIENNSKAVFLESILNSNNLIQIIQRVNERKIIKIFNNTDKNKLINITEKFIEPLELGNGHELGAAKYRGWDYLVVLFERFPDETIQILNSNKTESEIFDDLVNKIKEHY